MRSLAAISATGILVLIHGCGQEPTEPAGLAAGERYRLTIGTGSSSASGVVTSNRGGIECSITGATRGADASLARPDPSLRSG